MLTFLQQHYITPYSSAAVSITICVNITIMESVQQLDPSKYHVLTPRGRIFLVIALVLFVLVVMPIAIVAYYTFAINRPSQTADEVTYEVKSGASISQIAADLASLGAVNSEFLLKLHLILNNLQSNIQAGVYLIPAGTTTQQLARQLQHGMNDKKITFLEGWRAEEYAIEAVKLFKGIDYEVFMRMLKDKEGYLFPDTYLFNTDVTETEIMNALLQNFNDKTADILTAEKLSAAGLTKEQAVILASMVEREVRSEKDRALVAGILGKRLSKGELLGVDATVQYVKATYFYCMTLAFDVCPREEDAANVDWWPQSLSTADLAIDSLYNTRKIAGLPPTPISNTGTSALEAVINSKESDYNYYITDKNGETHYAKTLIEHSGNIAKYLQE